MGLRCLIGHEYGEPRTSQDRRQRGSEVVVTVREYRECTRCGHRRIISENKEVTADPAADTSDDQSAQAAWTPDDDVAAEPASSFPVSDADLHGTTDEPVTAAEDDGVILDDEPDGPPRGHGEWPESDLGAEPVAPSDDDHETWPDESTEPAEPAVDGPASSGDGEPAPDPDAPADTTPDGPDEPRAEMTRGASARSPRPDSRNIEFVCPECSETWPSQNASLRPGDICPSCRRGYLDEQVVQ